VCFLGLCLYCWFNLALWLLSTETASSRSGFINHRQVLYYIKTISYNRQQQQTSCKNISLTELQNGNKKRKGIYQTTCNTIIITNQTTTKYHHVQHYQTQPQNIIMYNTIKPNNKISSCTTLSNPTTKYHHVQHYQTQQQNDIIYSN
jgi:hypothetical protein